MSECITAVVENGLLRPTEPLELPEGETVQLQVVRHHHEGQNEQRLQEMDAAFRAMWEEARKYPPEWWDEFERDLRENRLNFEERT
jgi:predicted DNA-binding antitoxin AbrB/MazE fold protein